MNKNPEKRTMKLSAEMIKKPPEHQRKEQSNDDFVREK